jgi:hypothetical protein
MAFQLAEYPSQAQLLVSSGRRLLDSFENEEIDQEIATADLEAAAASRLPADHRLGFAATVGGPAAAGFTKLEDALAAAMLDLQSANLLLSAGAALNDRSGGGRTWLKNALADVGVADRGQRLVFLDQAEVRRAFAGLERSKMR